jgi:hypothetical protein
MGNLQYPFLSLQMYRFPLRRFESITMHPLASIILVNKNLSLVMSCTIRSLVGEIFLGPFANTLL